MTPTQNTLLSWLSLLAVMSSHRSPFVTGGEALLPHDNLPAVYRPARMVFDSSRQCLVSIDPRQRLLSAHQEPHLDTLPANWQRTSWQLPGSPSDLVLLDSQCVCVTDTTHHQLHVIDLHVWPPQLVRKIQVARDPFRVALSSDKRWLAVGHRWSRKLSFIDVRNLLAADMAVAMHELPLDFAPGELTFAPESPTLLVADAFQGHLLAVNVERSQVLAELDLHTHNIAGMAWDSGNRLLLTAQKLHPNPTTDSNIAGGLVLENLLLTVEFDIVTQTLKLVHETELGTPSQGAADPAGIALDLQHRPWIAVAGADHLLQLSNSKQVQGRFAVGRHPTQLISDPQHQRCFVLEEFEPAIRIVNLWEGQTVHTLTFGPAAEKSLGDRGEDLFFDARLSQFEWMTCHSCHSRGHTNGRLADTFGDGTEGAPKSVPSLLGGRDNNPWAWNGSMQTLHGQVTKSLETTMHSPRVTARDVNDIVAYLHVLALPPPQKTIPVAEIQSGQQIFQRLKCHRCHIPPLTYTSDLTYDVGLADEHGLQKFNPPSLLGVGQRFGYLHDLRAPTLESVFRDQGHQLDADLNPQDLHLLIQFLKSL